MEGQLGNRQRASSSAVPVAVASRLNFVSLAAGAFHTCGLVSTGHAWCWGACGRAVQLAGTPCPMNVSAHGCWGPLPDLLVACMPSRGLNFHFQLHFH